jgi:hypothetical protein
MATAKRTPRINNWPVVMYPEGVVVGKVSSGKDTRSGKVRHVAKDNNGRRVGTFDSFKDAQDELIKLARGEG